MICAILLGCSIGDEAPLVAGSGHVAISTWRCACSRSLAWPDYSYANINPRNGGSPGTRTASSTRALYDAGVPLVFGTDTPFPL